ncbi:hypothetical protein CHLRE_12g549000v5 [Chlamydomonas reinhardtii]|uniref:Pherophorin domain-containing protein n=1 Tax=Chlamydomonas reinhardtii TaxID=3055 RepID=A8IYF5_CHLRE|nr:uncharacterized protein CHLRE_12g549000v5 [Chlamydomonas reinhardtii]PNW76068.1 hypothetical protein CHLRE_12g549000v5 [Chlamydomonas reinhardtii]|eukprot:XP_001694116.1 cell wall protein pherophorin-C4 [Chlamydomonas reinhardtii]
MRSRLLWACGLAALLALAAMPAALGQKILPKFPYCRCVKKGPYALAKNVDEIDGYYCFEIEQVPCGKDKCCKMDLRKVEFDANVACRDTTKVTAMVNGLLPKQQPTWTAPQDTPAGKAVLKLSGLGLNITTAPGSLVCLKLDGQCNTLEKLCAVPKGQMPGICAISMFNTKDTCCPISQTGWPFPPPPPPPSPRPSPPPRPPPSPPPPRKPSPPPSPPASCPICITLNTTDVSLTREVCDNLADYVNSVWVDRSNATLLQPFSCSLATPSQVKICAVAEGKPDTVDFAGIAEDTYEIQLMLEELGLSCAFPSMMGTSMVYLVEYGTCRAVFTYVQDCKQPGPQPFPFCVCNRRPKATPFALDPTIRVKPGSSPRSTNYCWTATTVAPYDPTSPCGKTNELYKAEFYVRNNTRGAVTGLTAAGKSWSPVWDSDGKVFRLTNLMWTVDFVNTNKPQICVELTGITLGQFCVTANCQYALFDASKSCCPMGTASLG